MTRFSGIAKGVLGCMGGFVAFSVVASKAIDAHRARREREIDACPNMQSDLQSGQCPFPREIPKHKKGIYESYLKRPLDFGCACAAFIALAPLMGLTALAVRAKLGTPILFRQKRPGVDGRVFEILKFRTMTNERDSEGKLLPDAQRLTPFGTMLRSTSIDELPELINIMKGDMSIVGPRPLLVKYLPYYTDAEIARHSVRPGLTGLAQATGRNSLAWPDRLALDTDYVDSITFAGDVDIIAKTVGKVLRRSDIQFSDLPTTKSFMEERAHDDQRHYDCALKGDPEKGTEA